MNDAQNKKKRNESLFSIAAVSGIGSSGKIFKSPVSAFFSKLSDSFVYTSTRTYGIAALSYGISSIFVYFAKSYAQVAAGAPYWILGLALAAVGFFLICFDKPMCTALQDFPITDYVLFEFFLIKRMNKNDSTKPIPQLLGITLGIIPATVSVFVDPVYVILALLGFVFVISSFVTPEFPLIFGLLAAPYLSPIADMGATLAVLTLLSFVSFVRKVALGKRVYNLSIYDIAVFPAMILVAIGGAVNNDMRAALVIISLSLAYIPASNLVVNRRLADCAVNAIIASSMPVAVLGIANFAADIFQYRFLDDALVFSSVGAYLAYSLFSASITFVALLDSKRGFQRFLLGTASLVHAAAIVVSLSAELWIAVALTVLAYLIINAPRVKKELLILLLALPFAVLALPNGALDAAFNILGLSFSASEMLAALRESLDAFLSSPVFGVGVTAGRSVSNLPLSILASFGVIAAVIFALAFLLSLVQMSRYSFQLRASHVSSIGSSCMLSMFAILAAGLFFDAFSDVGVYFLFVSAFGIFTAATRIAKVEYDERLGYFGDHRADDAYVVDLRVVK